MKYITISDSIDALNLSIRPNNALKRAKIMTVGQLMELEYESLMNIRNMGLNSVKEVMSVIDELKSDESESFKLVDSNLFTIPEDIEKFDFSSDYSIEELGLNLRTTNMIKSVGVTTIQQLQTTPKETLLKIKYMRLETVNEIYETLDKFNAEQIAKAEEYEQLSDTDKYALNIADEIASRFDLEKVVCIRIVLATRNEFPSVSVNELVYQIYQNRILKERLKETLLQKIKETVDGVTIDKIIEILPSHLSNTGVLENVLKEMEQEGLVKPEDGLIKACYMSILEFAKLLGDKYRKVVISRLSGKTLEEIGDEIGVTRERVRQISVRALRNKPTVKEDKYLYVFNTYDMSKEDFDIAFQEPDFVYNYLSMVSSAKSIDKKYIGDASDDENLSVAFRKGLEKATYKNYITASGERVLKSRPTLVEFFVRNYCKNLTPFKDFADEYHAFLLEHNLNDKKYTIEERTYMNHLSVCDYALWNMNKSFRYYDINSTDKYNFIKNINLNQYKNKEISTLKIYRDYPELMKEYDIRDEYELHNYLKKIWPAVNVGVKFGRMPTLVIGEADKDQQALNLLIEHSPIGNYDLADLYEKEYGVKAYTALYNYFGGIAIYLYNSIYTIPTSDMPQLDEQQYNHLRSILTEDFYFISDIEGVFCKEYPEDDVGKINPYTIKKLGFMVYSSYVVSTRFESANDYFRRILTTDDLVDARGWDEKMYLPTFLSVLYMSRSEFEIVEYLPLQYMNIRKLKEYGVTKDDLKDYANSVKKFVTKNQFFTIHSLRKNGFNHKLDELGFEDWFYSSLLAEAKEDFSYRRMSGDRLFAYQKEDIVYVDLIIKVVHNKGKISVDALNEYICDEYGFEIDKVNLKYDIRNTKLYYDGIMKNVYPDYEAYLKDVE